MSAFKQVSQTEVLNEMRKAGEFDPGHRLKWLDLIMGNSDVSFKITENFWVRYIPNAGFFEDVIV